VYSISPFLHIVGPLGLFAAIAVLGAALGGPVLLFSLWVRTAALS